ncbi:helix-turn-helix domain-containing protein [Streptomyces chilikensis]|uniref:helix-turn-helix domain-containing protein n=1 Tax=Streptomyces chilikensis TaxID=1194079 RepID=UPI000AA78C32|nr:helix-turn-helix domain-containing protein [Streptomyces chilikensis]
MHERHRHDSHFTVVGNHLAQHRDLSFTAMGVAVHIQSLPPGARVDIKTLARDRSEGTTRIAAALRELERHGYLRRERTRVAGGRIVTRTVYCDKPGAAGRRDLATGPASTPTDPTDPTDRPTPTDPTARPTPSTPSTLGAGTEAGRDEQAGSAAPEGSPQSGSGAGRKKRKPLPAVPQPHFSRPELVERAVELLTGLRRHAPELTLSACDVEHLTPGVVAWLEREATPHTVRRAMLHGLPEEGLRRPAAFVAYRLTADLPAPLPARVPLPAAERPPERHPLRNCEQCDRGYRGPDPQRCRECVPDRDRSPALR